MAKQRTPLTRKSLSGMKKSLRKKVSVRLHNIAGIKNKKANLCFLSQGRLASKMTNRGIYAIVAIRGIKA